MKTLFARFMATPVARVLVRALQAGARAAMRVICSVV